MNKKNITTLPDQGLKECFIITPIGAPESEIFKKTEGLINSALRPVLIDFDFIPMPAHYIDSTGSINKQIIEKIVNSELVIANLTGINPNVMYELAIRHSFGKKVITVAEYGTKLPFDIIDQRTLFYHDTMHGVEIFKTDLSKKIKICLEESLDIQNISNPVFDALKQVAEIQNLPQVDRNALTIILDKLNQISPPRNRKTLYNPSGIYLNNDNNRKNYQILIKGDIISENYLEISNLLDSTQIRYDIKIENGIITTIIYNSNKYEIDQIMLDIFKIDTSLKIISIEPFEGL